MLWEAGEEVPRRAECADWARNTDVSCLGREGLLSNLERGIVPSSLGLLLVGSWLTREHCTGGRAPRAWTFVMCHSVALVLRGAQISKNKTSLHPRGSANQLNLQVTGTPGEDGTHLRSTNREQIWGEHRGDGTSRLICR